MLNRFWTLTIGLVCMATTTVHGQEKVDGLSVALLHQKVTQRDGKEVLVDAALAKPGEVIEYSAKYQNHTAKTLRRVEATLPIPPGTTVMPTTAQPSGAWASVDGANFQTIPLKRKVKLSDGREIEQLVPFSEYRFLRWRVGALDAGQSAVYAVRVKVDSGSSDARQVAMSSNR